jgi:serine/threonine protein kinase
MKQCMNCHRFLSDRVNTCLYCKHEGFNELEFASSAINPNYTIYASEIIVDDQAYTISNLLGKGGFGTVIEVKDMADNRNYAMKVPLMFDEVFSNNKANPEEDIARSQKYLENEIDTFLKYMDDSFLYIYKKGTAYTISKGKEVRFPVLIMELAECTINDLIQYEDNEGKIIYDEKIKIIRETVNTISHLHSLNVLHRDLSPANIFAVDRGKKISYVLGDFGTTRRLAEMETGGKSTKIIGNSAYMDPARFEKKYQYDLRTDIYSLGIIVVEVLMGKSWLKVFGEENISHLLTVDFEKEFLLAEGAAVIYDKDIIEILRKAVKRNPEDRYDSVDDFRKGLFEVLEINSKKLTQTPKTSDTSKKMESRNRIFDFYFTVPLPFEAPDHTFAQDIIIYQEGKKIELSNFLGGKIEFEDFIPRQVKVENTSLYSASATGSAVLLNFKKKEFTRLLDPVTHIQKDLEGELHFKGTLEIIGEQL